MLLIQRLYVEAVNLVSVGYHAQRQILDVELPEGDVVRYLGVPAPTYVAFVNSDDKDAYYMQHIKDQFVYHKQK